MLGLLTTLGYPPVGTYKLRIKGTEKTRRRAKERKKAKRNK